MRRLCFALLIVIGSVLSASSMATTSHRPIPDAGPSEVPDRTPQSDAVLDTMFAQRGERVCQVIFCQDFSPGGTRDIPATQIKRLDQAINTVRPPYRAYLIGASDPERFEATRRKVSQMNNWTLGPARASWLNAKTGYRATVLATTIINDRRGVYLVIAEPMAKPVISRRDTVVLKPQVIHQPSEETGDEYPIFGLRPFVGLGLISVGGMNDPDQKDNGTLVPQAGLQLWLQFADSWWLAPYYYDGWNFGQPGFRQRGAGLDLYFHPNAYVRFGGTGNWLMNANTGYAQQRAIGFEAGLGIQPLTWLDASLVFQNVRLTTVDDRHPRSEAGIALVVRLGPGFEF